MQEISVIYFDLGKVLADFDWHEAARKISEYSDCDERTIYPIVTSSPLAMDYELGRISSDKFFRLLKEEIRFHETTARLRLFWSDIFTPIEGTIQLAAALRVHYPIGIISNTNEAHIKHIRSRFDFLNLFSIFIFSYEAGSLKPQREIFGNASQAAAVRASEILFIDDLAANVEGAHSLGWRTIHLTKETNLLHELKKFELRGLSRL
jgi:HAD superfamily hydrolase (TIGR01509 family)